MTETFVSVILSDEKVEDIYTDTTYCNYCGSKFNVFDSQQNFAVRKDKVMYGSEHDGDAVELNLCCRCFDKIVGRCLINPIIEVEPLGL